MRSRFEHDRTSLAAIVGGAILLSIGASHSARADVPISGSFVATTACPAFQSFRKSTNPGGVQVAPNETYEAIAKNKPDATHYRIVIEGADPDERWVAASCGHIESKEQQTQGTPQTPAPTSGAATDASSAKRATHVLAMGWEPTFCDQHRDKSECRAISSSSFSATHLSLHGLWPQPRGTQYCNVPVEARETDENHDWSNLPEPEMSPGTLARLAKVMPGVQSKLQRHEWIVHGTCFDTNADVYFARAADLAEAINASEISELFANSVGKNLSTDSIRAGFDRAFGPGAGARVTVSCRGRGDTRKITELIINLAGDVKGSAGLSDLIQAAPAAPSSCPGGLIEPASFQ